ncbi:Ku protein [Yinghuangia sp. YIM S09857]|uniref:Ku protein n=1 Tax=Yinghuangia sp. YIM S09857 TaxID=3436929 RepID=UPI003F52F49E
MIVRVGPWEWLGAVRPPGAPVVRPFWSGAISFGLVSIPCKVVSAIGSEHAVKFHQMHRTDQGRVRCRKVCELDGRELDQSEIARVLGTATPTAPQSLSPPVVCGGRPYAEHPTFATALAARPSPAPRSPSCCRCARAQLRTPPRPLTRSLLPAPCSDAPRYGSGGGSEHSAHPGVQPVQVVEDQHVVRAPVRAGGPRSERHGRRQVGEDAAGLRGADVGAPPDSEVAERLGDVHPAEPAGRTG